MPADDDPLWYDRIEPDAAAPRWLLVTAYLFGAVAAVWRMLRSTGARLARRVAALRTGRA